MAGTAKAAQQGAGGWWEKKPAEQTLPAFACARFRATQRDADRLPLRRCKRTAASSACTATPERLEPPRCARPVRTRAAPAAGPAGAVNRVPSGPVGREECRAASPPTVRPLSPRPSAPGPRPHPQADPRRGGERLCWDLKRGYVWGVGNQSSVGTREPVGDKRARPAGSRGPGGGVLPDQAARPRAGAHREGGLQLDAACGPPSPGQVCPGQGGRRPGAGETFGESSALRRARECPVEAWGPPRAYRVSGEKRGPRGRHSCRERSGHPG